MEEPSQDWEREKEFFGYYPLAFFDDVSNTSCQICADGFDDLEKILLAHAATAGLDPAVVKKGVDDLFELVKKRLERRLDKFELYALKNCFRLPPADPAAASAAPASTPRSRASPKKRPKQESASPADISENELDRQIAYLNATIAEEQASYDSAVRRASRLAKEVKVREAYFEKLSEMMNVLKENNVAKLGDVADTVVNKQLKEFGKLVSQIKEYVEAYNLEAVFAQAQEPATTVAEETMEAAVPTALLSNLESIL